MFSWFSHFFTDLSNLYYAVFSIESPVEAGGDVKRFVAMVAEKDYINAGAFAVELIKKNKSLDVKSIIIQAKQVNLDILEIAKVIDVLKSSNKLAARNINQSDYSTTKAIYLLNQVIHHG